MEDNLSDKWVKDSNKLSISLELNNFMECIDLVNKVAKLAEGHDHHPDIQITNYKNLKIEIYTHSEDKVTEKDYALALAVDKLL